MAREILFKAKDKDDGKWYEGYYMCLHDTTYCCMPSDDLTKAKKMEEENTHHYIVFELMTDWGLPNRHLRAEILPKTLCQYTGLTDKNGKKIWENDVCKCEKRGAAFSRCIVKWNQTEARFDVNAIDCNFPMTLEELMNDISIKGLDYEVIGNIFDNPELLEESHE